jgi:hypothetical protein
MQDIFKVEQWRYCDYATGLRTLPVGRFNMAYIHNLRTPVTFSADPVDPNSTDWLFITAQNWLRTGESISAHAATIEGGTMVTSSTSLGTMTDTDGTSYTNCYGVEFSVASGASKVKITWRFTTTTTGAVDLGRTSMDFTAILPVRSL